MVKANKVVDCIDEQVASYLDQGFDQIDEQGNILAYATGGRTVTLSEMNAVKVELAKAQQAVIDQRNEIKVLEDENDRLDKLVKSLKQGQQQKR